MFTGCRLAMLGLAPKQTDMSAKLQGISAALCQGSATAGEERGSSSLNVSKQHAGACRMKLREESQGVCWQSVYVSRVGHTWLYSSKLGSARSGSWLIVINVKRCSVLGQITCCTCRLCLSRAPLRSSPMVGTCHPLSDISVLCRNLSKPMRSLTMPVVSS